MTNKKLHQCTPIEPQPCNSVATKVHSNATTVQPTSLRALVAQRFSNNSPCNKLATSNKIPRNSIHNIQKRIHAMARKWGYSNSELNLALSQAEKNPAAWKLACDYDEGKLGCYNES